MRFTKKAMASRRALRWALAAYLATLLHLTASDVLADEFSLLLNTKAIHLEKLPGGRYNENNWGVGLQYDFGAKQDEWIPFLNASEFQDSNDNLSYYGGGGIARRFAPFPFMKGGHLDIGLITFLMYRKGFQNDNLFPGILPVISAGNDKVALNITYIPKVDPKMVPILFFQLKFGLSWLN